MCNSLWSVLLTSVKERKREQHTLNTHATPVQHMQQSFLCWKHTKQSNEKGANDIGRETIEEAYSESGNVEKRKTNQGWNKKNDTRE